MDLRMESAFVMRWRYAAEITRALDFGLEPDAFAVQMWEQYVKETEPSIQPLFAEAA